MENRDIHMVDLELPEGWGPVAIYESPEAAHDAGLAVLAMGHAYWLLPYGEDFFLCVADGQVDTVRRELDAVSRLGSGVPSYVSRRFYEFSFGPVSFLSYLILLVGVFAMQQSSAIAEAGRVNAENMVVGGEWWRSVTALTLHGDIVHLVSNLVAGVGFAFFVARFFGTASGWFLILLSGAMGNALNAWVHHPEPHLSIGASTAVFGASGIITGIGLWAALVQPAERWTLPRWLLPAFGGLTLLGLLGVGEGLDGGIDVAAHISGFLCGGLIGLACSFRQSVFVQLEKHSRWIGLLPLVLIALCWLLAMS